jgi:phosphoribosylglycinamide formyltransferase-1
MIPIIDYDSVVDIKIAVFASGRGSNFKAILEKIESGAIENAEVAVVVSNNSRSGALQLAVDHGIEAVHFSSVTHPNPIDYEQRLLEVLDEKGIRLILLAGYMKLLPPLVVRRYQQRILNIHPALLPRHGGEGMYGLNVHRSVIESGERETGVTIHYVNERYDEGAIIRQRKVPVLSADTPESLAARVLEVEHDLYWRVVDSVVQSLATSGDL